MKKLLALSAIALATASSAYAEGVYFGTGVAKVDAEELGYKYGSTNFLAMVGYEINPYISIEAETSLSLSKDKVAVSGSVVELGVEHFATFAKFSLPTSGSIKPYARLGMSKGEASVTVGSVTLSANDTSFSYGLGAEYVLNDNSGIRFDYSTADYGTNTTGTIVAITSVYRF